MTYETTTAQHLTFETIRQQIHDQVMLNFLYDGSEAELDDDASLIQQGILDATGILELVLFVEDAYELEVAEADLIPENFDTVTNIATYVLRQLANM